MAIRIIAGQFKGRKIQVPDVQGLRPTPDRVRTTLFNWLQQSIYGLNCLDAFAGSGVLGLEAISRGAQQVTALESDRVAASAVNHLLEAWQVGPNYQMIQANTLQWLTKCEQTFELIFLDPPFESQALNEAVAIILQRQLLTANGLIYIEDSKSKPGFAGHPLLESIKNTAAGDVTARLYKICMID